MEQQITLNSKDESHYNYISQTIPAMSYYEKVSVCVTSLVTNCNIRILNQHDYIEFVCIDDEVGGVVNKFYFGEWTTSYLRNAEGLISIMSDTLKEWGIEPYASKCGTITFCSTKQFYITDCTYNVKLVMGLYNRIGDNNISADNPLQAVKCSLDEYIKIYGKELGGQIYELLGDSYVLEIKSMGMFLTTPVLYLLSNIGSTAYRGDAGKENMQCCVVVMRVLNSFCEGMPIVANNGEFVQTIPSNSITGATFRLVDANMADVDLLNPMYITLNVRAAE